MLAGLPLIALILLFLLFWNADREWRSAILTAAIAWGVLITAFTEVLSLFHWLNFGTVLGSWLTTSIILGEIYYRLIRQGKRSLVRFSVPRLTPVTFVLLGSIIFSAAIIALIAVVAPPNNWDSMTYHMARVVHWIQNRSVAHYPTYYSAQLVHPPFAEFAIMHLQILSGSDRFANLVQWFSMIGSLIGVSLMAKQLGSDRRGQLLAAVFCATIPMGILQASSTQNDYVVAFWLVCLAHFILEALSVKKWDYRVVLGIGASLGLAVLTKSSGYIYAFPFMVWFFLVKALEVRWKIWKPMIIIALIFLSLNISHYLRNLDLYGSPIATAEYSEHYRIEVYSLPTFISNVIKNLSLHVDIVRYLHLESFITPITGKIAKLIALIHRFLGVDPNDPRFTNPPGSYRVTGISFDENIAGNPLDLLLVFLAIFCFFALRKTRQNKIALGYLLALLGGFFLLCLMLKWQIYQSRHHLSFFVLFSPLIGLVFSQLFNRHLVTAIAILLIVTSMPWVFNNKLRPIIATQNILNTPRNEQYFVQRLQLKDPYLKTAEFLKEQSCSTIGLSLGSEAIPSGTYWEYPFWVLLQDSSSHRLFHLEHIVNPQNLSFVKSNAYPHNLFEPCAIIAIRKDREEVKRIDFKDSQYLQKKFIRPVNLLIEK
jgi:4-amino-4-deoxy-L-arabinose transferase-like glycosyltransferase